MIPNHPPNRRDNRTTVPKGAGGRARRFVFVPPNMDGFMMVHKIVGHELDWLRRRFICIPPNLFGVSNLFTALNSITIIPGV